MISSELERKLRHLRLSGLAQVFDVRLQQAVQGRLSHQEFFELLIDDELTRRRDRLLERRLRQAQFPEQKHLEEFNFSFNPSINRQQIFDLATCRFIPQHRGWLVIGQTGVGKSHLIITVGIKAVEAGHRVQYRSAFDLLEDIAEATATGRRRSYIAEMTRIPLLILEDLRPESPRVGGRRSVGDPAPPLPEDLDDPQFESAPGGLGDDAGGRYGGHLGAVGPLPAHFGSHLHPRQELSSLRATATREIHPEARSREMTGEVGAVSAGLPTAQRPWDSAPGFVDCPIRGRGQVRVGQRSSLVGPLSEGFLEKGKQGRNRVVDTKQRPGKPAQLMRNPGRNPRSRRKLPVAVS